MKQATLEQYQRYVIANYTRYPVCLVRGEGSYVWDDAGNRYLDFFPGWGCNLLGHCPPRVVRAVQEQVAQLIHVPNTWYMEAQGRFAQALSERSFGGQAFFCNSGAEANEAAIKLARAVGHARGGKFKIITMRNGFHGRTFAALSATAQPKYHAGFEPMVPGFSYVPFNDLDAVAATFDEQTAAVLVEPVQGEGGVNVPDEHYLAALRRLCDASGALLIVDEIQTGVGRTGRLWAYEHSGVEPDIMTLAKALANGIPIGAMLTRNQIASVLGPGTHGSTFGGTPFVASVALATLTAVLEDKIPDRAARMGQYLMEGLGKIKAQHRTVKALRGRGLLIGIELDVAAGPLVDACREAGVLVLTAGEKVLRLAPPLIVSEKDCDRALGAIAAALGRTV